MPLSPIPGASLKDTLTGTVAASTSHTPDSGGGAYAAASGTASNILIGNGGAYSILAGGVSANVVSTLTSPLTGDFLWQGIIEAAQFTNGSPFARPVIMDSSGNFYCVNLKDNFTYGLFSITSGNTATQIGSSVTGAAGTSYLLTINRVGTTVTASLGGLANMTGTDASVVGSSINRAGFMFSGPSTAIPGPYSIGTNAAATSYNVWISGGNLVSGVASTVQFQANGLPSSGIVVTPVMGVAGTWSGLTGGTITLSTQFVFSATFTPSATLATNTLTCTHTGGGFSGSDPAAYTIPAVAAVLKPTFGSWRPAAALAPTLGKGVILPITDTAATPLELITEATIPVAAGAHAGTTLPTAVATVDSTGAQGLAFISGNKELRPSYTPPIGSNTWTIGALFNLTNLTANASPISLSVGGPAMFVNTTGTLALYNASSITNFSPPLYVATGQDQAVFLSSNGTTVTAYVATRQTASTYSLQVGTVTVNAAVSGTPLLAINSREVTSTELVAKLDEALYVDGTGWTAANVATFMQDPFAMARAADGTTFTPGFLRPVPSITGLTMAGDGVTLESAPPIGGTGARTYTWASGPSPTGTFTTIGGQTGRNLTLTGLARRSYAYYKRTATDASSNTATTVAYPGATRPAYKVGVIWYGDSYFSNPKYDTASFLATVNAAAQNANIFASCTGCQQGYPGYTSLQLTYGYVGTGSGAWAAMVTAAQAALSGVDDLWFLFRESINDAVHNVTTGTHLANIQNIVAQATTAGALVTGKTARVLLLDAVPLVTETGANPDADNTEMEAYRSIEQTVVDGVTVFRASPAAWQFFSNNANRYQSDAIHLSCAGQPSTAGDTVGFTMLANIDAMELVSLIVQDSISTSGGIFRRSGSGGY